MTTFPQMAGFHLPATGWVCPPPDTLLVVRLRGVLTAAEQQLVKTLPTDKGSGLLKQVRTQLMQTARPTLETMVQAVTGAKVVSLHHDISTVTGEEVVLFTLTTPPVFREAKRV